MKRTLVLNEQRESNGFTLIELLVVVTIIVLLTATAAVGYSQFLKQSRDARRKADLSQIGAAIEMYRSNNNTYPITIAEGASLCDPAGCPPTGSKYLEEFPSDPKSSTYKYYYSGSASDYTLSAHLETVTITCQSLATQCTSNCTYCLGPYGEK